MYRFTPSVNFEPRPSNSKIEILLLHYTGMLDTASALNRLKDACTKVSCHYLIDEEGCVYQLVEETMRAWHAGASMWRHIRDVNSHSIGIELVNKGHEWGYHPFPEPQMDALIALTHDILSRHPIPFYQVLGHADVAPDRKIDPGELFNWQHLARVGIGFWPQPSAHPSSSLTLKEAQHILRDFGYNCPISGQADIQTRWVLRAFQRHFCPLYMDGWLNVETKIMLQAFKDQRSSWIGLAA